MSSNLSLKIENVSILSGFAKTKDVGMKYAATRCRRSSICGSKYLPRYSVLQGLNLLQKHVNGNGNIPLF